MFECNRLSAKVWNLCVEIDKEYYKNNGKYIGLSELQKQTKKCFDFHAKNIHHVVHKYLFSRDAMFKSIKAKHENSRKVKLPYRQKKYFTSGWDYQGIKADYEKGTIKLGKAQIIIDNKIKRQKPVICYVKTIPENIVEIELKWNGKLCLVIKYLEQKEYKQMNSENISSIDLGEIHSITSIDNNKNAIIITGRLLRSIKQLRNKQMSNIFARMSRCKKDSRQYRKYKKALSKLKSKTDRKIKDTVHKITSHYVNYCLFNSISTVYYGDLDSATRNIKNDKVANRRVRQKLSQWCYGQIIRQLNNKLVRHNIKMVKIKEYYTSQKCPSCDNLNKPKGRRYECECGYKQHRDIVGAINILNDNTDYKIKRYDNLKYLQIA